MHILHIGLNRHYIGGGLVNHVDRLILKQSMNGYTVSYFSSGKHHLLGLPGIKRTESKKLPGITLYELVNSPNQPLKQRGRPMNEISDPLIESCFRSVLEEARPDIVHIHDLQGLCASIIDVSVDSGYPTTFTFHNYWPLCPEVELFDFEGKNCIDFQSGLRCVTCNYSSPSYYLKLSLASRLKFLTGTKIYKGAKALLSTKGADSGLKEKDMEGIAALYVKRREGFVERINRCARLIGISNRINEIYARFGVLSSKLAVVNNPLFVDDQTLERIFAVRASRDFLNDGVTRFSYRGSMIKSKGIYTCIDAYRMLDSKRARLYLYGDADSSFIDWLKKEKPDGVSYMGRYEIKDLPLILKDTDVGIFPPIWEECFGSVGLEFMAAGVPVIASRIGGLPDYIEGGVNGIFFEAGNHLDLAAAMNKVLDNPGFVRELSSQIPQRIKTLDDLFREMDEIYRALL